MATPIAKRKKLRPPSQHLLDNTARALISVLESAGISYALCGGYAAQGLGMTDRTAKDVDCIVEGGLGKVKKALQSQPSFIMKKTLFAEVLTCTYTKAGVRGQKVMVKLLMAGEFGPKSFALENTRVQKDGLQFLSPTEFVRAKVKAWERRREMQDVLDVLWMLQMYGSKLDDTRINPDGALDELRSVVAKQSQGLLVEVNEPEVNQESPQESPQLQFAYSIGIVTDKFKFFGFGQPRSPSMF